MLADVVSHEQWLKTISRKDWQLNTTSNYFIVCGNHFKDSRFVFKDNYKKSAVGSRSGSNQI